MLPLVHHPDVLVFDRNLIGVVPSPLSDEAFAAAISPDPARDGECCGPSLG
ncbi:hypothetical protein [Micromonospora sp. NPDC005806]|uniref:hypothetical protein n=1 Tax=Micromonospora sp. NPDC005806 TaxID=3364234 RepID=UPI0036770053